MRLHYSLLLLAVGLGIGFFTGSFVGRMDGPHVVTMHMEPPIDWQEDNVCRSYALMLDGEILRAGVGWTFRDLTFDRATKTVSGTCTTLTGRKP